MYLITNGFVATRDKNGTFYKNGAVVVEDTKIKEVGKGDALKVKYPYAEIIDARGGVIMPAFINAHTHIYSALARGLSVKGYNPHNFYEVLDGMWWNIDRKLTLKGTRASAMETYIECIKNGVTTVFDHHASYCEIPGSLFEIADAAKETGIRSCLCYEVSDRDGKEKCDEAIKENMDFIRFCAKENDSMLKALFGMHAAFTLSEDTLNKCAEENAGMAGYHIHVSEGMNDVDDTREKYNMRPVERLLKAGILGEKTILGHCIHVTPEEMDIIKQTDSVVVNNPESNMGNAVGCSPVLDMYKKGILLGLGTDAYTHDMLESLKAALAIQRHNAKMPNVGWVEVTDMLFKNNALIGKCHFGTTLGVLEEGAQADIIVMDYKPYTPFDGDNIDGHMLFGMNGRQCVTTMANGRLLMKDRELIGIDEEAVHAQTLVEAEKLWKTING